MSVPLCQRLSHPFFLIFVQSKIMKYFLIAGEASGDLHASNLMKEIKKNDPEAKFRFLGGDLMEKVSGEPPVIHYKDTAFMGVFDVVKNIFSILSNFKKTKKSLLDFNPDAVILIDYPGFNLKMAKFAYQKGFKTYYYIAPKLWAWKEGRVKLLKKYTNKVFTILPFEKDFYKKHHLEVEYVGNPVYDAVKSYKTAEKDVFLKGFHTSNKPIIALLPGSRKSELKMSLPLMQEIAEAFPAYRFIITGAPGLSKEDYAPLLNNNDIPVIFNRTYDILHHAHAAIVTSGTATLETALFHTPQVVVYRVGNLQYKLFKRFVKIKYFSLVNLILDKPAVPELLQDDFNKNRVIKELKNILQGEGRKKMLDDYNELENILGSYQASELTAKKIIKDIKQSS